VVAPFWGSPGKKKKPPIKRGFGKWGPKPRTFGRSEKMLTSKKKACVEKRSKKPCIEFCSPVLKTRKISPNLGEREGSSQNPVKGLKKPRIGR